MCICFVFNNINTNEDDSYEIVIANNRDEYFARPTKSAHFWNSHCLSGIDEEPSRRGGTWFGVSTFGKIGTLLNILDPMETKLKKGRGFLVVDFLLGHLCVDEYTQKLMKERDDYNKFNLVLFEKKDASWQVLLISNYSQEPPRLMESGIMAFGNSPHDLPWKKVELGKQKFSEIIENYNSVEQKDALKENLIKLLSDRTSQWPDSQIMSQLKGMEDESIELGTALSSNFVDMSQISKYGTRTHTILLIDKKGHGEYTEVTMDSDTGEWKTTCTTFDLK